MLSLSKDTLKLLKVNCAPVYLNSQFIFHVDLRFYLIHLHQASFSTTLLYSNVIFNLSSLFSSFRFISLSASASTFDTPSLTFSINTVRRANQQKRSFQKIDFFTALFLITKTKKRYTDPKMTMTHYYSYLFAYSHF